MNIERYKWPVIVAASLHGALFLITSHDSIIHPLPVPKIDPGPIPPEVRLEIPEPAEIGSGVSEGAVTPIARLPEVIAPEKLRDAITIPTVDRTTPDKPITDLTLIPATPGGPGGDGPSDRFGGPHISTPVDLDRVPRAMAQSSPEYPYAMRQASINGSVTVEFIVGVDGHVTSAEATRWTHREFVDSAIRAVLRWKFEPGTVKGRKVRFRMAVPIEFNAAS